MTRAVTTGADAIKQGSNKQENKMMATMVSPSVRLKAHFKACRVAPVVLRLLSAACHLKRIEQPI
jgi:hypothetical protein